MAAPLLAGRYAHLRELGRGASGRVLLAEDRVGGGTVAIKVVSGPDAERLRWERALLGALSHPSLARVHELLTVPERVGPPWSVEAGAVALVEEHVDGPTAGVAAAALGDLDARVRFAVEVGVAIARALGAIHAAGLVHQDVKPSNVVVPEDASRARLVDLGLCRPPGHGDRVSGTVGFLAPEALLGERSPATDLYALGATLHALLSGRTALDSEGSELTLADALARRPRVAELPAELPLALRRLVGDLLADRPDERPDGAREVALRLSAIAADLGLPGIAPIDASIADAPSGAERAARATVRPLIGRAAELEALIGHLARPGVVAVVGPTGAGRSRLIREAVRELQAAPRAGGAPTYVALAAEPLPRLAHDAIVHLARAPADGAACRHAVEAAEVQRLALAIVIEASEPAEVPDGARTVTVGPVDDDALRTLLAELLEVDPSRALVTAARTASGGLPGRLVRLVAEGLAAGLDPSRPATLADLGRQHLDAAVLPAEARSLAEALVVAGGALHAAPAAALFEDSERMARALLGAGAAVLDPSGAVRLREDVRAELAIPDARRRELARALTPLDLDPLARAWVELALGRVAPAVDAFRARVRAAREAGDPERAAALGLEALAALAETALPLRLDTADALRACAREAHALALLAGEDDDAARAARAELARLAGDAARAEAEALASGHPDAAIVLARLALARGDLDGALARLDALEPSDRASQARADEIRVFVALARGRFDDATRAARDALRAAARAGGRAALARAASVEGTVLQARGLVDDAAACFERAFELAERAGERYAAASYLVNVALGRLERGAPGPAIEALREGARRLTALGRRRDATRALYNLANAAALVGDDAVAASAVRRAREWAIELGDAVAAGLAAVVEADLSVRAGKLDLAIRVLDEASATAADAVRVTLGARRAVALAIRGDLAAAGDAVGALAGLATDRAGEVERAIAGARVALAAGDATRAADHAAEALDRADGAGWESQLRAALSAAEAFERAGRGEEARAVLARARALLDAAAATLPPHARARLRAVPAYQRALTAAPSAPAPPSAERHRALARHAKRLVREPRVARLHEAIVDAAVELADAERGFFVRRAANGELRVLAARAFGADLAGEVPSMSVAGRVLDSARPLVALDALEDDRLGASASVHQMALRSVLAVPLPLEPASAIVLDDRLRPAAFDPEVVEVISDLAELAAGAIQRAEALRRERREARRLARERRRLAERVESVEQELTALRQRTAGGPAFEGIVAASEPMRRVLHLVERVASSDAPVLVRGESGTGKELVARAIHDASGRRQGPWVTENCSAIPEPLLESTLFGHVRGAFTGADHARRGLFEIADGGTLFLDEIGEMSEPMQAKLLRVLQDGELRPIGGEHTRRVDVRLVAATHRDLPALVEAGRFRRDLYYRIAVVTVELPALRERPDDIPVLVAAFLERHAVERAVRVEPRAMRALRAHAWPGNVRELENEIRRALVLADETIGVEHLSPALRGEGEAEPLDELDLKGRIAALERRLIRRALESTSGNQTRAAALLGLSRYGLQKMIKRLGLS